MPTVLRILLAASALVPVIGSAQITTGAPAPNAPAAAPGGVAIGPDLAFLASVTRANATEMAAGKLAVAQGKSAAVKAFGERMVKDHGATGERLQQLAQQKGSPAAGQFGASNSQNLEMLRRLSGDAFDRAYAHLMVGDHQQVIDAFQREITDGTDPDIRDFAATTLPTIREHLSMAQQLVPGAGT